MGYEGFESSEEEEKKEKEEEEEKSLLLTRHADLRLVLDTPKGRGVFAAARIPARSVLETCPVLVLDPTENKNHVEKTDLFHYTYNWPLTNPQTKEEEEKNKQKTKTTTTTTTTTQAIILGLGSMFNHSTRHQNVGWERDIPNGLIIYKTLREVEKGEELCISYGDRLWFDDADDDTVGRDDDEEEDEDGMGGLGGICVDGEEEEEEEEEG